MGSLELVSALYGKQRYRPSHISDQQLESLISTLNAAVDILCRLLWSYLIDCVLSLRLPPVPRAVTLVVIVVVGYDRLNRLRNTHLWPVVPFTHSRCHRNNQHTRWTLGKSQKLASSVVSYPCFSQIRSICEPEIPTGSLPV